MEVFVKKKAYVIFMKQVVFKILQEGPVKFEHNNVMLFRPNIDGDILEVHLYRNFCKDSDKVVVLFKTKR